MGVGAGVGVSPSLTSEIEEPCGALFGLGLVESDPVGVGSSGSSGVTDGPPDVLMPVEAVSVGSFVICAGFES